MAGLDKITYRKVDRTTTLPSGEKIMVESGGTGSVGIEPTDANTRLVFCVQQVDLALSLVVDPHPLLSKTALVALMRIETGSYIPRAVSPSPAMGVSQFIQSTAYEQGVLDYWNYGDSIKGMATYFSYCLKKMNDLKDRNKILIYGAMGYNAGPGYQDRSKYLQISEANDYGKKFQKAFNVFRGTYNPSLPELVYVI